MSTAPIFAARNTVTGFFFTTATDHGRTGFYSPTLTGRNTLDAAQAAVVKATYLNVEVVELEAPGRIKLVAPCLPAPKHACMGSGEGVTLSPGDKMSGASRKCPYCGRVLRLRVSALGKVSRNLPRHNAA